MAQENSGFGCKQWCWLLALAAGLIAAILLHRPMHGWFWPIVLGALVCVALGWLLTRFLCSESTVSVQQASSASSSVSAAPAKPAAAASAPVAAPAAAPQAAPAAKANGAEPAKAADIPPAAPVAAPAAAPAKPAAAKASKSAKAAKPAAKAAKPAAAKAAKPAAKAEKTAKPVAKASRAAKPAAEAPAFVMQPVTRLKGEEDLAAQKGDWKYDGNGQPAAEAAKPAAKAAKPAAAKAAKPAAKAAKPAAEKASKAAKPAAKSPATRKAAAPKAAAPAAAVVDAAAVAAAGAGKKPRGLKQARNGRADDLKIIEGIGPAIEKFCNDLGIFHFDQIAGWGASDVAWMDQNIPRFPGRVSRDKWVSQARIIGAEGIPAFLERAKTNNY